MKNQAMKEALATYLDPIVLTKSRMRIVLGLPPLDLTSHPDIEHKISYFTSGYSDGSAGYYDRIYDERKDWEAYQAGNMAGRELYKGENFTVI